MNTVASRVHRIAQILWLSIFLVALSLTAAHTRVEASHASNAATHRRQGTANKWWGAVEYIHSATGSISNPNYAAVSSTTWTLRSVSSAVAVLHRSHKLPFIEARWASVPALQAPVFAIRPQRRTFIPRTGSMTVGSQTTPLKITVANRQQTTHTGTTGRVSLSTTAEPLFSSLGQDRL